MQLVYFSKECFLKFFFFFETGSDEHLLCKASRSLHQNQGKSLATIH